MKWLRILAVNAMVLLLLFCTLEITTRALFPEYVDAYFDNDTTWGHPIIRNHHWGHRVNPEQENDRLTRKGKEQRVLFIGDSVTFGYGVDYADTYHEVAQRRLERAGCSAFIHGVGQYNTNLRKLMRSSLRDYILHESGANFIVYQFNVNDIEVAESAKIIVGGSLTWREAFEKIRLSYLNRSAFLKLVQSWSARMSHRNHPQRLIDEFRYSQTHNPSGHKQAWQDFEQDILRLNEELRAIGIRFSILLVPESLQISHQIIDNDLGVDLSGIGEWPSKRVTNIATRHGIPVFDALPALQAFRAAQPDIRLYFPNDQNHPNQRGHAVIGEAVARYLLADHALCSLAGY
jgi:lysophospholipase L1-like esterase